MDLQLDLPQLRLYIDRVRSADLGLSTRDVALAVNMLAGGLDVARYNDEPGDGERYDVRLKAAEGELEQPADLGRIYLKGRDGHMVRLDSLAGYEEKLGPAAISRFDRQYAANFYATPTVSLGEAVAYVEDVAADLLPLG